MWIRFHCFACWINVLQKSYFYCFRRIFVGFLKMQESLNIRFSFFREKSLFYRDSLKNKRAFYHSRIWFSLPCLSHFLISITVGQFSAKSILMGDGGGCSKGSVNCIYEGQLDMSEAWPKLILLYSTHGVFTLWAQSPNNMSRSFCYHYWVILRCPVRFSNWLDLVSVI